MTVEPGTLSEEEVFDLICRTEEKYDLLQHEVDGWCVWPTMRFGVSKALTRGSPQSSGVRASRLELLRLGLCDVWATLGAGRARFAVLTSSSSLSERVAERYKDPWFDDLLLDLGDYFKLETYQPAYRARRSRALIPSRMTTTALGFAGRVLSRGLGPASIARTASALSTCLIREFGLSTQTAPLIARILRHGYWAKQIYARLLDRLQPEFLLLADPGEAPAIAAAKSAGVRVVEFQHGINHNYHPGYAWTSYAIPYKRRMPIPDRFFVYGEYWKHELEAGGFWGSDIRTVGSIRVDQYRALRADKGQDARFQMVVTTQGIDRKRLARFLGEFMTAVRGRADIALDVKLHPSYDPDREPYLNALADFDGIRVMRATEGPSTFELLARADMHVSISSAVHYEALGLGIRTIVLPLETSDIVAPLYKAGHATLVNSAEELAEIVTKSPRAAVPLEVRELYFRSGALENIKRELIGPERWSGLADKAS